MWRSLVLTVDPAVPPVSGAELRNWQNARALSKLGHVRLVSLHPIPAAAPPFADHIACASLSEAGEARSPALARRQSSIDVRLTRPALGRMTALVGEFAPDAILVEGIPLFPFLEHLRPLTTNLVLDMHNIESDLRAQIECGTLFSRLRTVLTGGDARRIRKLEQLATEIVHRVWVCSESDKQKLRAISGHAAVIDVVPNGIPRPESIPATVGPPAPKGYGWPVILFVGHLSYAPNVLAAHSLVESVLPLIRADYPAARLIVAGRSPSDDIVALASKPGVELVANPEGLSALYAKAHLAVIPLRLAGGTRIKVLEAMAYGLPVIATSLAIEGLDLIAGSEVLVSGSDRGLADHVRSLCSEPRRFEALRQNARRTVLARFGADAIDAAVRQGILPRNGPGDTAV